MEERIQILKHKGKEIVYVNYSGYSKDNETEFIAMIEKVTNFILKRPPEQLFLVNVENAYGNSAILNKMKVDSAKTKHLMKKQAVLGITGAKAVLLKAINMFALIDIKPFNTIEEAKEWLVKP